MHEGCLTSMIVGIQPSRHFTHIYSTNFVLLFKMADWMFNDAFAAIQSPPSIPTSVLQSIGGFCLGDICFTKIQTTLRMQTMSMQLDPVSYLGSAIFNHLWPPEMLFCQRQHPMLTLVSSISVHAIQNCAPMCTTKASNPLVSPLGVMFTYNNPFLRVKLFLTQNSTLPSSEFEYSPLHVLSRASLLCEVMFFFVLIHLRQAANSMSSCCTSSQLVTYIGANLRVWACAFSSR